MALCTCANIDLYISIHMHTWEKKNARHALGDVQINIAPTAAAVSVIMATRYGLKSTP